MFGVRSPSRIWIVFLLFALALHALLLTWNVSWQGAPPPMEVDQVSAKDLSRIRDQWKRLPPLLGQPKGNEVDKAPDDAKVTSDKNTRVEREQKARSGGTTPRSAAPPPPPKSDAKSGTRAPLDLGNLGVPLGMQAPPQQRSDSRDQMSQTPQEQLLRENLEEGNENLLNTRQTIYHSFYARVQEMIGPYWESKVMDASRWLSLRPGDYTTVVDVVLNAQGEVTEVRLDQSSGYDAIDQAAIGTFRKFTKLPNPPKALLDSKNELREKWSFRLQLHEGGILFHTPRQQ